MIFDDFIGEFMAKIISLWAYSCNLYQQERVKNACLYLQESYDIDVTALLFCCWFTKHYQPLNSSQITVFKSQVTLWSEHCIRPLRHIRQQMKPLAVNAVTPEAWLQLREQVKTLELDAEKQLLAALEKQVFEHSHLYTIRDSIPNAIRVNTQEESMYGNGEDAAVIGDTVDLLHSYFSASAMLDDSQGIEALGDILHAAYPEMQYHSALKMLAKREVST